MIKYTLIAFVAITVACFGAETHLADGDSVSGHFAPLKSVFGPGNYGKGPVYTDQGWSSGDTIDNGLSIYEGPPFETADDYTPSSDVLVNEHVVWLLSDSSPNQVDLRVDWFSDSSGPGSAPPGDVFNEVVPVASCTWTDTGETAFSRTVWEVVIPTADVALTGGTTYWLGISTSGASNNAFWCGYSPNAFGSEVYFWYQTYWTNGAAVFGAPYDVYFALNYNDTENPTVTDQFPTGSGVPIDVHPGCHWQDNVGINTGNSTFTVSNGGAVSGTLNVDDTDPTNVIVEFIPDSDLDNGITYTVDTYTEDLDGNSATDSWTFDTVMLGVESASLGEIKANFK